LTKPVVMTKRPRTPNAACHLSAHWARFECTARGGLWLGRLRAVSIDTRPVPQLKYGRATDRPWGVLTQLVESASSRLRMGQERTFWVLTIC